MPVPVSAHSLLTHSLPPLASSWFFQIGTAALSSSISARHAVKASARCGLATATTTARSPMSSVPSRCTAATPRTSWPAAIFSATRRSSAWADGCAV